MYWAGYTWWGLHAANLHDSPQGVALLNAGRACFDRLEKIMANNTYKGTFAEAVGKMGIQFEVPQRPENTKGFVVEA